jgi:type III secretion protein R
MEVARIGIYRFNEVNLFKKVLLFFFSLFLVSSQDLSAQTQPYQSFPNVIQVGGTPEGKIEAGQSTQQSGASFEELLSQQEVDKRPSIVSQASVILLLSLLPYLVILLTAFLKIVVVLSLLRNALGIQQSPPNQVINGLALILSIYVMYPTGMQMYNASKGIIYGDAPQELVSKQTSEYVIEIVNATKEPLKAFLIRNTDSSHLKSFLQLINKVLPPEEKGSINQTDFLIVIPSYITSQLKDAYEIGVLIYLPFFVIDLVVSNILLAMGMMMLSPLTISLPLKLLLLVMIDGWTVLVQGLVLTFR